jgi:hypothetical protein
MKTRRGTHTKIAKTVNADASATAMVLVEKAESLSKELKKIEASLADDMRLADRTGAGREIKNAITSVMGDLRSARSNLFDMVTVAQGWAVSVETGFLK